MAGTGSLTGVSNPVLQVVPLGSPPWPTVDPFLFCVHHNDAYPAGNGRFGPSVPLVGRPLGNDFTGRDGWSMYHGRSIPGFPQHPHRGFETVTLARRGLIDHSDSMGATARFGRGDVQWMTAGGGVVHSEMFPLLDEDGPNPAELFQIWMNLPRADKMVEPHFAMLWDERIPRLAVLSDSRSVAPSHPNPVGEVTVVAGELAGLVPPPPPPHSWAAHADNDVAIWVVRLDAGAAFVLPAARSEHTVRTLYHFVGESITLDDKPVGPSSAVMVDVSRPVTLRAGAEPVEVLVLQGRPIGEPVAQYGPFVLNDRQGIEQAFDDYQRTQFGGWPWPDDGPVHGHEPRRFARHADGTYEEAPTDAVTPA